MTTFEERSAKSAGPRSEKTHIPVAGEIRQWKTVTCNGHVQRLCATVTCKSDVQEGTKRCLSEN